MPVFSLAHSAGGEAGDECGPTNAGIPMYLTQTYTWAYIWPKAVWFFDRPFVVSAILWGNYRQLLRAVLAEISAGEHVYQPACVYGDFSLRLAGRLGPAGRLDIADIVPIQVENARQKLRSATNATVRLHDAGERLGRSYDVVCCFFLLHEMPSGYKRRTVDALLEAVAPGGKAIFVDYHRPGSAHPLRWAMSLIFERLEPFAKDLWRHEIASYASRPDAFVWSKKTCFGGLYQKVVARRRAD